MVPEEVSVVVVVEEEFFSLLDVPGCIQHNMFDAFAFLGTRLQILLAIVGMVDESRFVGFETSIDRI